MGVALLERGGRTSTRPDRTGVLAQLRHIDAVLVVTSLVLCGVGLVMVYSATRGVYPAEPSYFLKRQLLYAVIGIGVMVVTMFVDYRHLEEWGYFIYGAVLLALLAVRVVGRAQLGAQREISLGPLTIQPSEFGVIALIVVVALVVQRNEGELPARHLGGVLLVAAVPMLLVVAQPDLGTTLIMGIVLLALLVFAGVRARHLLVIVVLVGACFFGAVHVHLVHGYQLQRLEDFFHQSAASQSSNYDLDMSKQAIGAGGLRGTGLFQGAETNNGYVPEAYADFIFSAVGEQLGFVGAATILALFGVVAFRMLRAAQTARDDLGRLICGGALAFVVFSVFENVGMSIGIMPITGIPLPFISYGGSALFAFFAIVGLVANVEMHRPRIR